MSHGKILFLLRAESKYELTGLYLGELIKKKRFLCLTFNLGTYFREGCGTGGTYNWNFALDIKI